MKRLGVAGIKVENVTPGIWVAGCERNGRTFEVMGASRPEVEGKLVQAVRYVIDCEAYA